MKILIRSARIIDPSSSFHHKTKDILIESGLITDGSMENGIAFGVFDTQNEAFIVQSQLARLGYAADVEQASGVDPVIRVLVRVENSPAFEAQIWPQMQLERPYLDRTENLCETIAQGGQFP